MPKATMIPADCRCRAAVIRSLNVFTTDVCYHRDINKTGREMLGSDFSTSTMVQVVALARPELLL